MTSTGKDHDWPLTPDQVCDAIAEVLSVDPERVMIDGRSSRICLHLDDARNLLKHVQMLEDALFETGRREYEHGYRDGVAGR